MPYEWIAPDLPEAPAKELHLWPYRSLPKRGFVTFFAITAGLVSVPLLATLGTAVLWGLLPFIGAALAGLWVALGRSYRDGSVLEELRLWPDRMTLTRQDPRGGRREWEANPHWVSLSLYESDGPVPAYLTLRGNGREVEIGAFLTEAERRALEPEIRAALARLGT